MFMLNVWFSFEVGAQKGFLDNLVEKAFHGVSMGVLEQKEHYGLQDILAALNIKWPKQTHQTKTLLNVLNSTYQLGQK